MKNTCLTNIICMIVLGATAGGAVSGFGKTIVYPGDELKPAYPTDNGSYWPDSLFPEDSASGNEVFVNDGGDSIHFVFGNDISVRENVMNNSVTISGGKITVGGVYGGYSENVSVMGNSVTITGGAITQSGVSGGYSATSVAAGNSVTISGGVIAGHAMGGSTNFGFAVNNSITVSGGVIEGYVIGGRSSSGSITGNSVTISGGKIENHVLGGFSSSGDVTGNSVTLKGSSIQFSEHSVIYGGHSNDRSRVVTGNTLILDNFSGNVGNFCNFERVVLSISSLPKPGDDAPVIILHGNETTLKDASLSISVGNWGNVAPGQSFSLIRANDGVDFNANGLTLENSSISGVAMRYELLFSIEGNLVNATIVSSSLNPQTRSLSEGRIVPLALTGQAADLVASLGVNNAALAAMSTSYITRPETFFAMTGGHSSYDTGSHVDLSGFSALAGVSTSMPETTSLVLGAFLETGWGKYSTHHSFEDAPSVRGSGDSSYHGGGLLARWDVSNAGLRGVVLDASFRAGSVEEDFSSGDLTDGLGNDARYDLSSPYYGAHAGVTFSRNLTRTVSMTSYARFLWSRVEKERAMIGGDEVTFHALDSNRLQGGARFHYEATPTVRPYAGVGYEWECSGTSRAVTYGNEIAAPSLRGGTGTLEAGVVFRVAQEKPVFLDLGVKGYAGKREGVSGNVQLRMAF